MPVVQIVSSSSSKRIVTLVVNADGVRPKHGDRIADTMTPSPSASGRGCRRTVGAASSRRVSVCCADSAMRLEQRPHDRNGPHCACVAPRSRTLQRTKNIATNCQKRAERDTGAHVCARQGRQNGRCNGSSPRPGPFLWPTGSEPSIDTVLFLGPTFCDHGEWSCELSGNP
jgi:hypothetical protein